MILLKTCIHTHAHTNIANPTAAAETMTDSISQRQTASWWVGEVWGGGGAKESEKERERTVVSESLLVIGFSHWSKLFFSFLLFSGLSFAAWKINPKRSSWAAGLVHSSRALWANFPAQRANSEREGERGGQWEREREREMMMKAIYESSCCWVSTLLVCVNVCVCVCALLRCLSGRCGMKSTQKHSLYCTCTCPRI